MLPSDAIEKHRTAPGSAGASDMEYPPGRAAPNDGTSCRPAHPSPIEFDAARRWRAARAGDTGADDSISVSRVAACVAVLCLHVLIAVVLERSLAPSGVVDAVPATPEQTVLQVNLDPPRRHTVPETPSAPAPPLPVGSSMQRARARSVEESLSAPDSKEPPLQAAAPVLESPIAKDPLDPALWSPSIERAPPQAATRSFNHPSGPSLGELLDRPIPVPGTASPLARMWAPEGETLGGEFIRRTTVVREFKNRWGGRFRCAISPVTFGLPVCAFGIAPEPLPNAPLAPNEAPRDGRLPLGAPRP
jgi:hypothetical protein